MSDALNERLNKILPRVISDDFLSGSGIGNEIAFYIFDYPPEDELRVRDYLRILLDHIPRQKPDLRVQHVNLFDFVLDYLKRRNLLDKTIRMQKEKGDREVKKALAGPLNVKEKLIPYFCQVVQPQRQNLLILSGVGSVYPLLRTSTLLSTLQSVTGTTPLVLFYPGKYDQVTLALFGKLSLSASFEGEGKGKKSEHYYRAFKLVP
jgi:hypothetical protein